MAEKYLSKVKLEGVVYNLKDAQARQDLANLLTSLKAAAYKEVTTAVETAAAEKLPTSAAVKNYVDAQVGTINKFDVVVDTAGAGGAPATTASEDTMYQLTLVPDDHASAGTYIEWITIRSGSEGAYTYAWEKIGSTQADLTGYVVKTAEIAGIEIGDGISVEDLQEALELGQLAYRDYVEGTVNVPTEFSYRYTPAGDITLNNLTQTSTAATLTKGDYTPAGSVAGTVVANGSIDVTLKDADAATAVNITRADYTPTGSITGAAISGGSINVILKDASTTSAELVTADYTPAGSVSGTVSVPQSAALQASDAGVQISGSVSKPSITVTPTAATVLGSVKTEGVLPTKAADSFDAGSFTKGTAVSAALDGVTVALDTTDTEMLVFTAADKGSVMDYNATYVAPTFTEGTFTQGSMPVFENASVVGSATAALDDAPVFTGGRFAVNLTNGNANINASFAGTEVKDFQVTGVNYNKQEVDAKTFTPVAATLGFDGDTATGLKVSSATYLKQVVDTKSFTGASADISASFTGTKAEQILVTGVNYDKATANGASFTGTEETIYGPLTGDNPVDVDIIYG